MKKIIFLVLISLLIIGGAFLLFLLFVDDDVVFERNIEVIEDTGFRPTSPRRNIIDPVTGFKIVSGEVIVVAEDGVTRDEIARVVLEKVGGIIVGGQEESGVYQVEIPGNDAASVRLAVETLKDLPAIKAALPNYVLR